MLVTAITTFGASPWLPKIAVEQVALLDLGRLAGARAAALHVDDDQRDLGHHREADAFLLERVARARR